MQLFKSISISAFVAVGLTFFHASAFAQGAQIAFGGLKHDSSQPVEITSDQLSVDQSTGKAIFSGDVLIGQGSLRLTATTVEVIYDTKDTSQISQLVATGGVTFVNGGEAIEAKQAVYDIKSASVTLTGDVILTQGQNALSGQRMVVDLATGTGQIEGRVKTILQPGTQ
ncbi:lipopolysaccharide transport periplasmic protein LptA [Pacificibacter sp. AS14]|uniref:lipopolysaccharide transport periplasmic protein LptA n=1 Tax=Pacificibacter sp. AS14 TaxID=3135785 RepID=UPI00317E7AB8